MNADAPPGQGPHAGVLPARLRAGVGTAHVVFVLAWLSVAAPLPAAAVDAGPPQHRDPVLRKFQRFVDVALQQNHVTGHWGGLRDALESAGVTLTATDTTDLLGNPVGGNTQGFRYAGDMAVDLHVDLDKLWGLNGMLLDVSGSWRSGQHLSAKDIGNTFTAAQIFGGETVRLYALALEWPSLFDNRVDSRMGRIGAGDDCLASPLYTPVVHFACDGNPGRVPINIPSFSAYPVATWGLRTKVRPVEPWSVLAGLYDSDAMLARHSAQGIDFSIRRAAGVFVSGALGDLYHQDQGATGLPGTYKIGAYVDANGYPDLSRAAPAEIRGNYGF
jgi:porin